MFPGGWDRFFGKASFKHGFHEFLLWLDQAAWADSLGSIIDDFGCRFNID